MTQNLTHLPRSSRTKYEMRSEIYTGPMLVRFTNSWLATRNRRRQHLNSESLSGSTSEVKYESREDPARLIRLSRLLAPSNRSARRRHLNSRSLSGSTSEVNYEPREERDRLIRLSRLIAPGNRSARRRHLNSKSLSGSILEVNYEPREEPARPQLHAITR